MVLAGSFFSVSLSMRKVTWAVECVDLVDGREGSDAMCVNSVE